MAYTVICMGQEGSLADLEPTARELLPHAVYESLPPVPVKKSPSVTMNDAGQWLQC